MISRFTKSVLFPCAVLCMLAMSAQARTGKAAPGPDIDIPEGEILPDTAQEESQAVQPRPVPPEFGPAAPVTLTAYISEGSTPMMADVTWRVYAGKAQEDGSYKLIRTVREARPTLQLDPGEYFINIVYGRAHLTKKVGVWPEKPMAEDFVINAGGLRIYATLAKGPILTEHLLKFDILSDAQDQFGNRQKVLGDVRPATAIRLNSGLYHIVSTYGDGNSVVESDVVVEPGKITEAVIDHDAGKITFKLVFRPGGEAIADTRWAVYNAAGESVKESAGAFPTHIFAAGDYRVTARHGDLEYSGSFTVAPGETKLVEVVAAQ
jgi:hypothetical protein